MKKIKKSKIGRSNIYDSILTAIWNSVRTAALNFGSSTPALAAYLKSPSGRRPNAGTPIRTGAEQGRPVQVQRPPLSIRPPKNYDLNSYSRFFDKHYSKKSTINRESKFAQVTVFLDIENESNTDVIRSILRIRKQCDENSTIYLYERDDKNEKRSKSFFSKIRNHNAELLSANCDKIVFPTDLSLDSIIALVPANAFLSRSALSELATLLDMEADVAYCDEDLASMTLGRPDKRKHRAPWFKPPYDPDLLHQTPYVGATIAFRRATLRQAGLHLSAGPHMAADALLRLDPPETRVAHIPRVLVTRKSRPVDISLWQSRVNQALESATARLQPAPPGAPATALRVHRPAKGLTAHIIIPTRDRLDLLKPCIESVKASLPYNETSTRITILDNESSEQEILEYLSELNNSEEIDVHRVLGKFNWARMNNFAALKSNADVLIFLNNDTIVISDEWIDELTSIAFSEEVGAVGAKLIYADNTIQHAGIISRPGKAVFLTHDGVGRHESDPGYLDRHNLVHRSVAVTGAAMAVRRTLFKAMGGFDSDHFPVDGNDVDFCMRIAAAGYRILYNPHAKLYHFESKSRGTNLEGEKKVMADAAAEELWRRWGARFGQDPWINPHFSDLGPPFSRLKPPISTTS